jgi:hypothetical protein
MEPSPNYFCAVEQDRGQILNAYQTPPPITTLFKTNNDNIIDTKTTHNNSETLTPSSFEIYQEQLSRVVLLLSTTNEGSKDHLLNNKRHKLAARYCELIAILKRDRGSEFQDHAGAFHNVVEMLGNIDWQKNPEVVKWGFKALIALAPDVVNIKKFKNSLASQTCKVVVDCLRIWSQFNSEIAHDGCTIVGILISSSSFTKKQLKELGAAEVVKNALVNPFTNKSDKDVVLSWLS